MKIKNYNILDEASNLTPYEKMREFELGNRRENVAACSDGKLQGYRDICRRAHFNNALAKIEAEMVKRGMLRTTTAQVPTSPTNNTAPTNKSSATDKTNLNIDAADLSEDVINTIYSATPGILVYALQGCNDITLIITYLLVAMALGNAALATQIKDLAINEYNYSLDEVKATITNLKNNPNIATRLQEIKDNKR